MKPLLLFLALYSVSTFVVANGLVGHDFSVDQKWLSLYRYQKNGAKFRSLVTNKSWFFSQEGQTSPQQEAIAAVKAFKLNPENYCSYPSRARHLTKLKLIAPAKKKCEQLTQMKEKLALTSVSLVFASSYLNNPSSAFGHTFFKLIGQNQTSEYSNWGFNFSAIQTTQNPLLYALYGLSGGFIGKFSVLPYFMKLKEYRDSENRDLWEYKLKLSKDQIEEFIEHLWEMKNANFPYYYLSQNCSFHLLAFLDAINPNWSLRRRLSHFTIPGETLKTLTQTANLVDSFKYYPSPHKLLISTFATFDEQAKASILQYREAPQAHLEGLSTAVIDFLIDNADYQISKRPHSSKGANAKKRRLLLERSKRKQATSRAQDSSPTPPHVSQAPSYLLLGGRRDLFDRELVRVGLRASLHDYLDQREGRNPWSKLVFGAASLSYQEKDQDLRLDKFTLIDVEANQRSPFSRVSSSWGFAAGIEDRQLTRKYDLAPEVRLSYGFNIQTKDLLIRVMLPVTIQFGKEAKELEKPANFSAQAQLGLELIGHLGKSFSYHLGAGAFHNTLLESRLREFYTLKSRLHLFKSLSLDIDALYKTKRWDYGLNLIKYF